MSGPSAEVGSAFAKIGLDSKELDSGMNSSKSKFSSFADSLESRAKSAGSAIAGALKTAVVAGGVAAAGAATAGLMSFKDLESAASSAASKSVDVNGKSVEEIKKQYDSLQKHVIDVSRELGQATVFDPTDVAAAYDALAGAGQNVANIGKNELLPFLNLASTDMEFGLGRTTELTMGMMNSWGMSMEDSGKIADMLSKGVNGTSASLEDYAYALKQSGSVAAGNKMPLQEYLAIIGDLKDHYIQGEMAGEALKTGMLALATPTKTQTDALAALGLTFDDINPATHDFMDIMGTLKEKGATISDFSKIFTDSSGSILYYAAQDTEKIKELTGSISDSDGLAQTMADLVMGSDKLVGSFEQAKGSTADLFIAIGSYLEPAAVKLLNAWTTLVPAIEEFGDAIGNGDWGKVGDMISEGITTGWETLYPLGQQLYNKIKGVNWSGLGSYVSGGIKSAWSSLYSLGSDLLGKLRGVNWGEVGTNLANSVSSAVGSLGTTVYNAFAGIKWSDIGGLIKGSFDFLVGYGSTLGKNLYDSIIKIDWKGISQTVLTSLEGIPAQISSIFSGIDLGKVWSDIANSASGAATKIYDTLNNIKWGDLGYQGGKALASAFDNSVSYLSGIGTKISGYITSTSWASVGSDVGTKIKGGIDTVQGWAEQAKTGFLVGWGDTGTKAGNLIKGGLAKVVDYATAITDNIYAGLKKWVDGTEIGDIGKHAGELFLKGIGAVIYAGATSIIWIGQRIQDALGTAVKWGSIGIQGAGKFAQGFVQGILETLTEGIELAMLKGIQAGLNQIATGTSIPGLGTWASDQLGPINTEIDKLQAKMTTLDLTDINTDVTVDTSYLGGSDPSSLDGKTYSATLNVKTYTDSSGAPLNDVSGVGAMGYAAGATTPSVYMKNAVGGYELKPLGDYAKSLAKLGYDQNQITDKIIGLVASSNTARSANGQPNIVLSDDALTGALEEAKPYIDAYALTHKQINEDDKKAADEINEDLKTSFGEAVDVLRDGIFQSNAELRSGISELTSAVKENTTSQIQASTYASNSLKLGGEVSGKFLTDAGGAVSIGLDTSGKQWAVIGQVANKQWTDAGNTIIAGTTASAIQVKQLGGETGQALKLGGQQGGTSIVSSASQAATQTTTAATTGAAKTTTAALTFQDKINQGASAAMTAISKAGDPASKLVVGAQYAANALVSAGQSLLSMVSSSILNRIYTPYTIPYHATGTITSGPQMAMIGEDGPSNPEFVIPTKTKRWDLLYQAMRAYGIPGFAAGTATGETGTGGAATDAEEMRAYFGIKGLASMSGQVQRIISDLKDFFRISWTIIKSEGAVSWKGIETVIVNEATFIRDSAWQGVLDIRNAWLSGNAAILADTTTSFAAIWPAISPSMASIHDSTIASFEDVRTQSISVLNQMNTEAIASLQDFEAQWAGVWSQLLGDLQATQSQISSIVQQIAAQVSNISVNVALNAGGGGGSSGGYYGGWSPDGGDGDWLSCGDINIGSGSSCSVGSGVSGGCPSYIDAVIASTGPLATAGLGVTARAAASSSGGQVIASNYQLPAIFRAKGALVDDGPELDIVGEAGPEMILPPKLTSMFLDLANAGLGANAPANSGRIVIEDHTVHEHYWNGKKVTDLVFTTAKKKMDARGGIPTK